MTGAGVDVLAPRAVEPLGTDAVRHAGSPGGRPADAGVEARSGGAAGVQSRLADRAAVAGRTEALERSVAGVQAESAVTARPTEAGVGSIFAPVSRETGMAQTLSVSLRA